MIKYALRDLIQIGQLYKTTGVKGEIIGEVIPSLEERVREIKYIFLNRNGQSLPFFIENVSFNGNVYFKFEGIDAPEQANEITNSILYLDAKTLQELSVDVMESPETLVGFSLFRNGEVVGLVKQMEEYPGQSVLIIEGSPNIVIPFVEEWINDIDLDQRVIDMNFPEELLHLND